MAAVPHGIDGDTYFSPSIPKSVFLLVPLVSDSDYVTPETFTAALALVVTGLLSSVSPGDGHISTGDVSSLASRFPPGGDSYASASLLLSGLVAAVSTAVRNRTKVTVVEKNLVAMNFPPARARDVVDLLRARRLDLEAAFTNSRVRAPSLASFRWRVDVAIATDALAKVYKPTILAEMTLSDGRIKTFEIPVEQFHYLRYSVAKVLRNMEEVERHPIMKLAFEAEKDKFDKHEQD